MKTNNRFSRTLMATALAASIGAITPWISSSALAQAASAAASAPADVLRPAVFKLAKPAQDLVNDKKYAEALELVKQLDTIADKTPFETYFTEFLRANIAQATNDVPNTIKAFEVLLTTGRITPVEQVKIVQQVGVLYYQIKNYPQAIVWLTRGLKEAGEDRKYRMLLIQAYYLNNDFTRTMSELRTVFAADDKAGIKPTEESVQLFGSAVLKLNDKAAYLEVLEKFVAYYPKREYWLDLLYRVETKAGFSERMLLDLYRLQYTVGHVSTANEFVDMAQLAAAAGFPGEAKKALDQAYQTAVMTTGTPEEVKTRQKLRDQINKAAADDLKTMANGEADANKPGKDGNPLLNLGYAFVLIGQAERGIALMEKGLTKGLGKRADEGKLHLGIAYAMAGRKDDAIKTFGTVGGADGAADLARYWVMHLNYSAK